jgi:hypothetical protein
VSCYVKTTNVYISLLAAVLCLAAVAEVSRANGPASPGLWRQTALTVPATDLFAPTSGALLARTGGEMSRTDDGGGSWRSIALPDATAIVRVDPVNHDRLVAVSDKQTYQSTDGGTSWQPGSELPDRAIDLALSGADATLAYAATAPRWPGEGQFRLLRSRDGLQSWETVREQAQPSRCGWSVYLLSAHPTDANRVFFAAECVFGGITSSQLQQPVDHGASWTTILNRTSEYPRRIIGGGAGAPGRMWLTADRDPRDAGAALHRSDDDGLDWLTLIDERAQSSVEATRVPELRGLTVNPLNADHFCLALTWSLRPAGQFASTVESSAVQCSTDAGATWQVLGAPGDGEVHDLAIGFDGANLFAATSTGVWVHPL